MPSDSAWRCKTTLIYVKRLKTECRGSARTRFWVRALMLLLEAPELMLSLLWH